MILNLKYYLASTVPLVPVPQLQNRSDVNSLHLKFQNGNCESHFVAIALTFRKEERNKFPSNFDFLPILATPTLIFYVECHLSRS